MNYIQKLIYNIVVTGSATFVIRLSNWENPARLAELYGIDPPEEEEDSFGVALYDVFQNGELSWTTLRNLAELALDEHADPFMELLSGIFDHDELKHLEGDLKLVVAKWTAEELADMDMT